jgi:hypothetical protein
VPHLCPGTKHLVDAKGQWGHGRRVGLSLGHGSDEVLKQPAYPRWTARKCAESHKSLRNRFT